MFTRSEGSRSHLVHKLPLSAGVMTAQRSPRLSVSGAEQPFKMDLGHGGIPSIRPPDAESQFTAPAARDTLKLGGRGVCLPSLRSPSPDRRSI